MRSHLAILLSLALPFSPLNGWEDLYAFKRVDPELPSYRPVAGVSGTLNSVGSDTLNNLMTLWAEAFQKVYPNVRIEIEGKGSSTAPPALTEGTARLGPMSREMKHTELDAFEARHGYKPYRVSVALDALSVYVHKDNPVEGLDLRQLDAIFSSTFKHGGAPVTTWGQLGLGGAWAPRRISVYGRNSASGTYGFFKHIALAKGDFKPSVKEQPGSSAVVRGVEQTLNGIGYSGIGYRTSGVRVVPLNGFEATGDNAATGDYPLARFLYIAANQHPTNGWNPLEREFFRMVLAKEGQEVVNKDGYVTLSAAAAARFRSENNLD